MADMVARCYVWQTGASMTGVLLIKGWRCLHDDLRIPAGHRGLITMQTESEMQKDLIYWVKVLCPTPHKIGHFGDVLPNTTKVNNLGTKWQKKTQKSKPESKEKLNQQSTLRTADVCTYHCAELSYTIQHRTVLIISPVILQTILYRLIDRVGFNVPLNTLQVISGTGFYGSNDPTNSVKAPKEVVVLRIGFNPSRSTSPCYNTRMWANA